MEKFRMPRTINALIVLGMGAAVLAACGQTDPPTPEEVRQDIQFVTFDEVRAANGEPVRCVMYGSESEGSNDSKSWFAFSCDFDGTAIFPGEPITR